MKPIFFLLLSLFTLSVNAQNEALGKYLNGNPVPRVNLPENQVSQNGVTKKTESNIYKAGEYLEKSAKAECMSLLFGAVGGGLAAFGASKSGPTQTALFVGSGVLGVASLVSFVVSIDYKFKSGKCLKMGTGGAGMELSYTF